MTNKGSKTLPPLTFMGDILTLSGSYSKVGRADWPIYVRGPVNRIASVFRK